MADAPSPKSTFREAFNRWGRRVRSRLALSRVLTGAAVGLVLGAAAAGAAWKTRHGALRPASAALGLLGAGAGYVVARRKRWKDEDVALFLDARLASHEAIATAIDLESRGSDPGDEAPGHAVVISKAVEALGAAKPKDVRAKWLEPWHAAVPVLGAAIAYVSLMPLPPAPPPPNAGPGADKVQLADLAGLEKVIALEAANPRDEAQRERLKRLAEEAKRIREKLKDGMEKREAQADLAKLKDGVTAERMSLGDAEERAGLESAMGKLAENPDLKKAERALGDHDLEGLDDEMEKLANKLEKNDREKAQKTLEEAAEAAKKNGAKNVAKALEDQKKRLEEKGKQSDKLKELAKDLGDGLGQEGQKALEDFGKSGSGKDQKKLEKALGDALDKMTPEQRKKLADALKKRMAETPESGGKGMSKKDLKDLAEQLGTPEGQKELEDQLKKMAEGEEGGSEEGERQKKLDDAEKGLDDAEGELGNGSPMPMPMDGKGDGKDGKDGKNPGDGKGDANGDQKGESGHHDDTGTGDHKGSTSVVEGGDLKSRASGKINSGKPMPGMSLGRTSGKAGETANVQGTGALGKAGPSEVNGVDRSDVPEEYREQVGRYFEPK